MKIANSIKINSSIENVFYWLEDPSRTMQWMTSVTKTVMTHETEEIVGSTFKEYIQENGKGTCMQGVVTAYDINSRMAMHLEGDYNIVDVEYVLESKDGAVLLTQNATVTFKGFLKIVGFLFANSFKSKIKKQAKSEFETLKQLCENDEK